MKRFCKYGHDTFVVGRKRYACNICIRGYWQKYNAANKEKQNIASRKWYAANTEKQKIASRKYYTANKEKQKAMSRKWKTRNAEKRVLGRMLYRIFGTTSQKKLPPELIDIGVLYWQLRKELRNGKTTEHQRD